MTPTQKNIEYYFYHYQEFCFADCKELSAFQKSIIPRRRMVYLKKKNYHSEPSAYDIMMAHVVEKAYRDATTLQREVIRLRYFEKFDRIAICDKLEISVRSYHRYITTVLEHAEDILFMMQKRRDDFDRQNNFFDDYSPEELNSPKYFSNHTFETY